MMRNLSIIVLFICIRLRSSWASIRRRFCWRNMPSRTRLILIILRSWSTPVFAIAPLRRSTIRKTPKWPCWRADTSTGLTLCTSPRKRSTQRSNQTARTSTTHSAAFSSPPTCTNYPSWSTFPNWNPCSSTPITIVSNCKTYKFISSFWGVPMLIGSWPGPDFILIWIISSFSQKAFKGLHKCKSRPIRLRLSLRSWSLSVGSRCRQAPKWILIGRSKRW